MLSEQEANDDRVRATFILCKEARCNSSSYSIRVLAFLISDDRELQRTAADAGAVKCVSQLLQLLEKNIAPEWELDELESVSRLREVMVAVLQGHTTL
jgi:hypothetical protein